MMRLSRPSDEKIKHFLKQQQGLDLTYQDVGATSNEIPSGFVIDRTRSIIGHGDEDFCRAQKALERWKQFQIGWVEPCWPETPIKEDAVVGVLASWCGLWFLNACRVVYLVNETEGPTHRYGFAYGTLPEHAECGEERFLLEYDCESQQLDYEILAFSKPNKWYTRLAYPLVRRVQKRFARDSITAMKMAVASSK